MAAGARLPRGLAPMLASSADGAFDGAGWLFEPKWDGYRALAYVDGAGRARLVSRGGKSLGERFAPVEAALAEVKRPAVIDGEVVALDDEGMPRFQWLQGWPAERRGTLVFCAFDLLWLDGADLRGEPLLARKSALAKLLGKRAKGAVRYVDHVVERGTELFAAATAHGIEGVVAKRVDGVYESGRRSKAWLKIKAAQTVDAVIGGYTEPKGSRAGVGAVLLGVPAGGRLRYTGRAGVGLGDQKALVALRKQLEKLARPDAPFETAPRIPGGRVHWVQPRLVCEVSFTEVTADGLLRHPKVVRWRDDLEVPPRARAEGPTRSAPR